MRSVTLKPEVSSAEDQKTLLQDEQRTALEKGQLLKNQLLETIQEQSLKLKENEFLVVKTSVNSQEDVSYTVELQKKHK